MPSFFAQREGGRAVIVGGDARHLARSLRARVGEEVEVVDPNGFLLTVRLDKVSLDRVEGVVVGEREHNPEPEARITIAIAQLPAPALELVLSRCTEAGAYAFHVMQADRSVARGAKAKVDLADLDETRDLTLLVGPEGGWSDRELALVATKAGLGPRNLRADTAALVALAVALARRR